MAMEKVFDKFDAILSLGYLCAGSLDGEIIFYDDKSKPLTGPTEAEIQTEMERLQAEYDAQEYARNRAAAFPSIGDQLDMQYHDLLNGTTTWKDAVEKVKSDNPKE
jgi:hypothetical protein